MKQRKAVQCIQCKHNAELPTSAADSLELRQFLLLLLDKSSTTVSQLRYGGTMQWKITSLWLRRTQSMTVQLHHRIAGPASPAGPTAVSPHLGQLGTALVNIL